MSFVMEKKLPKSVRKFIASEKARIRKQLSDPKKQQEAIVEMYAKLKIAK